MAGCCFVVFVLLFAYGAFAEAPTVAAVIRLWISGHSMRPTELGNGD